MRKLLALALLASVSVSHAAWNDAVKNFETKENGICKAIRTFNEGKYYSGTKAGITYRSYNVKDMYLNQVKLIFSNAFFDDGIGGMSTSEQIQLGGIYRYYSMTKKDNKSYNVYMDPISKYETDVCVEITPE